MHVRVKFKLFMLIFLKNVQTFDGSLNSFYIMFYLTVLKNISFVLSSDPTVDLHISTTENLTSGQSKTTGYYS